MCFCALILYTYITDWLIDWQTDWLTDRLTEWLKTKPNHKKWRTMNRQTNWLSDLLIDWKPNPITKSEEQQKTILCWKNQTQLQKVKNNETLSLIEKTIPDYEKWRTMKNISLVTQKKRTKKKQGAVLQWIAIAIHNYLKSMNLYASKLICIKHSIPCIFL